MTSNNWNGPRKCPAHESRGALIEFPLASDVHIHSSQKKNPAFQKDERTPVWSEPEGGPRGQLSDVARPPEFRDVCL